MKLFTILTLPAATTGEKARRLVDWAAQKSVHLIPRRVRYWVTMGAIARATSDYQGNIPAIPLDHILRNLPDGPR